MNKTWICPYHIISICISYDFHMFSYWGAQNPGPGPNIWNTCANNMLQIYAKCDLDTLTWFSYVCHIMWMFLHIDFICWVETRCLIYRNPAHSRSAWNRWTAICRSQQSNRTWKLLELSLHNAWRKEGMPSGLPQDKPGSHHNKGGKSKEHCRLWWACGSRTHEKSMSTKHEINVKYIWQTIWKSHDRHMNKTRICP